MPAKADGGLFLRRAEIFDFPAVYRVCVQTAVGGEDATAEEDDPDMVGHLYAGPYLVLEPDFSFVLDGPAGVVGYVVGAPDSERFYARMEREWLPPLRARIADPGPDEELWHGSDGLRHEIHGTPGAPPALVGRYPAHAHVNLLSAARSYGWGRRLMERLMEAFVDAGAAGVHLGVARENERAIAFYRALGFSPFEPRRRRDAVFMVKSLRG